MLLGLLERNKTYENYEYNERNNFRRGKKSLDKDK